MSENLWTTKDVAHYLNVSTVTVRNLAKRGDLPYIRVGSESQGHMRFDPEDVREFTESKKSTKEERT